MLGDIYNDVGVLHYISSQYDSALIYFNKALEYIQFVEEKSKADRLQAGIYGAIANMHNAQGNYHEALEYYMMMLKILEEYDWKQNIKILYYNMGAIYYGLNNFEEAEKYYLKTKALSEELNDSIFIASCYRNLSAIYIRAEDFPKALEYAITAYEISEAIPDMPEFEKTYILQGLAYAYSNGNQEYDKAEKYAIQALNYAEKLNFSELISSSLYTLADIYMLKGNYRESISTALKALSTDSTSMLNNINLYRVLTESYMLLDNPQTPALKYYERYISLTFERSNTNYLSTLKELETIYETEKKEEQITALKNEKRLLIWLSIAGGGVLLLALTTALFLWRWTVQKRQLAETRIRQLEQEKQLIATQSLLEGETAERTRLARDLHDGLGGLLTGVKMNLLELKKAVVLEHAEVQRFDQAIGLVDQSAHEMRRVAHHLMPDALTRFGLKSALNDFCLSLPSSVRFNYYGDETRLNAQTEVMIYSAILELVNNALKHAHAENIVLQMIQEPGRIALNVQDDGCGFDPATQNAGMGLQNVRTRVAAFNGVINIDSRAGEGTEVNVELRIES